MPKVERITGGLSDPLSVTRRKRRRLNKCYVQDARVRIRCGCCKNILDISHDDINISRFSTLEINGVTGTIEQWRQILGPLLGFKPVINAHGDNKALWKSTV